MKLRNLFGGMLLALALLVTPALRAQEATPVTPSTPPQVQTAPEQAEDKIHVYFVGKAEDGDTIGTAYVTALEKDIKDVPVVVLSEGATELDSDNGVEVKVFTMSPDEGKTTVINVLITYHLKGKGYDLYLGFFRGQVKPEQVDDAAAWSTHIVGRTVGIFLNSDQAPVAPATPAVPPSTKN